MRHRPPWWIVTALLIGLLSGVIPIRAQQPEVEATPVTMPSIEELQALADQIESRADDAFNLYGVFEAIGQAITVATLVVALLGTLAGLVGFSQISSARRELTETSERLKQEAQDLRRRFEDEIRMKEGQLERLRAEIEKTAHEERSSTSKALLANALIPLGERQYKTGDYVGALNTYNRALALSDTNPVVHQRLGYVYTQRGELEKAEHHYHRAIELEDQFAPALAGLGFVYRRMAERMEQGVARERMMLKAEDLLLQALEISPNLVDDDGESWWGVLGGLYKRQGNLDKAINAYERATEVTPQSSYGMGNLALLYTQKHDRERMLQTYARVERIAAREADQEQRNFWGYADLIVSQFALGKVQEAQEALPIALAIAPPDSPYMLSSLADTLRSLLDVLEPEKLPPIRAAIAGIELEQEKRQTAMKTAETDRSGGDNLTGETE